MFAVSVIITNNLNIVALFQRCVLPNCLQPNTGKGKRHLTAQAIHWPAMVLAYPLSKYLGPMPSGMTKWSKARSSFSILAPTLQHSGRSDAYDLLHEILPRMGRNKFPDAALWIVTVIYQGRAHPRSRSVWSIAASSLSLMQLAGLAILPIWPNSVLWFPTTVFGN